MEKKSCTKCGEVKPLDEFSNNRKNIYTWKYTICKGCKKLSIKEDRKNFPEKYIFIGAKYRAKKKGIPFNITIEDIVIPKVCPVFNKPFVYGYGRVNEFSPSLDRIIPSKGYVKGNIIVISHRANMIKSNATINELEALSNFFKIILK